MKNICIIWSEDLKGESTCETKTKAKENIAASSEHYSLSVQNALKWFSAESTVKVFEHGNGTSADPND